MFTEIDVSLNGKIITPWTDTYPYKAYLEKLLSNEPRTLRTQMKACSLLEKDTPGYMDDVGLAASQFATQEIGVIDDKVTINRPLPEPVHPEDSRNEGLRRRHEEVEDSVKIVLMDRLYVDLFQQEEFILNGVDIRLRFNRA